MKPKYITPRPMNNNIDAKYTPFLVFAKNKDKTKPAIVARPPTTPDIVYAQTFQSTPLLTTGNNNGNAE